MAPNQIFQWNKNRTMQVAIIFLTSGRHEGGKSQGQGMTQGKLGVHGRVEEEQAEEDACTASMGEGGSSRGKRESLKEENDQAGLGDK